MKDVLHEHYPDLNLIKRFVHKVKTSDRRGHSLFLKLLNSKDVNSLAGSMADCMEVANKANGWHSQC